MYGPGGKSVLVGQLLELRVEERIEPAMKYTQGMLVRSVSPANGLAGIYPSTTGAYSPSSLSLSSYPQPPLPFASIIIAPPTLVIYLQPAKKIYHTKDLQLSFLYFSYFLLAFPIFILLLDGPGGCGKRVY